jgi:hypothetical protein
MSPERPPAGRQTNVALALILALSAGALQAAQFDPRHHFRSLTTPHFVIYFHQGEDQLAARLATIAEDTWRTLRAVNGVTPPPRTRVVLVDEADQANGSASPLPYDTLQISAAWPSGSEFIGNTNDWLHVVFAHEFAHVAYLDRSEGWALLARHVFGRTPVAFPNLFLPAWQIEGYASFQESAITGSGRLYAGDFLGLVREAARSRVFEPVDRLNGGLTDWPGGLAPYVYGLGFHAYLAERFGAEKLADLARSTAGRVPYTTSPLFHRIFGEPIDTLWRDFAASAVPPSAPDPDDARRLTHHGFEVAAPRFMPSRCADCPDQLVYSIRTPHEFSTLNTVRLDGSLPERLATRFSGLIAAAGRTSIYFDRQEARRNAGLYSDLYALDRSSGRVRRLTAESRLLDPDLSPDERTIVCVQNAPGRRDLVLVHLGANLPSPRPPGTTTATAPANPAREPEDEASGLGHAFPPVVDSVTTLVSEPETQFNAPRWSPDGRAVAVERHRPGSRSEVVIVDVASRRVRVVATARSTRFVTPTWRPDGRAIIAAAAPDQAPFNLVEIDTDVPAPGPSTARLLTHTTGGALWPDVSPDGRTIVYVGYTVAGFDLFRIGYPTPLGRTDGNLPLSVQSPASRSDLDAGPAPPDLSRAESSDASDYSPFPTLRPTSWSPVVTGDRRVFRVGATTGGTDVLGRHAYLLSATWLAAAPADASTPESEKPDWQLSYTYDRWQPSFFVSAARDTSFFAGPPTGAGAPSRATMRSRKLQAGVLFPVRHVRTSSTTFASFVREVDDFLLSDGAVSRNRAAVRVAWAMVNAHQFGYSISPERGVVFGATAELVRRALGSAGDATSVTADARFYLPGASAHHVAAIRIAAGMARGDSLLRRSFHLGGAAPSPGPIDFGRQAFSLMRAFPSDTFAGRHVALVNADYRWPLARPQRGHGRWPLFLHTVHAAAFVDAGQAWEARFQPQDMKISAGLELSADIVAGYWAPFTMTLGSAWGRDGIRGHNGGATVFVRVGRPF